ncbi:MAG: hypothetical protein ACE5IR_06990 [bacterium]
MKRFYLASPCFSWALTDFTETGRLLENLVISLKDYKFFWRDPYHHEVDFINIEAGDAIVPIEIKYKKSIQRREIKNLLLFAKKFACHQAIVFTKEVTEKSTTFHSPDIEIIEKPIYKI